MLQRWNVRCNIRRSEMCVSLWPTRSKLPFIDSNQKRCLRWWLLSESFDLLWQSQGFRSQTVGQRFAHQHCIESKDKGNWWIDFVGNCARNEGRSLHGTVSAQGPPSVPILMRSPNDAFEWTRSTNKHRSRIHDSGCFRLQPKSLPLQCVVKN